jgi:hypothetical protein
MPINHELKIVFIHIPKNAGTSVEDLLDVCPDDKHQYNHHICYGINPDTKLVMQSISYKLLKRQHELTGYDLYAVCRDPYDRVISDYTWNNRGFKTIGQYIKWIRSTIHNTKNWDDLLKYNDKHTNHIVPQWYYLSNDGVNPPQKDTFKIIRFENLSNDDNITKLKQLTGRQMPWHNRTKHGNQLDDISKSIVKILYKKDFELFGYCL